MTGIFPILPTAAVRPGCKAMPWARTSPHRANAPIVASVRPTPLPPMVTSKSHEPVPAAFATRSASRAVASASITSAPAPRAVSAISCAAGGAAEVGGAERPTIDRGDVVRRNRLERRHIGGDAAQRLRERKLYRRDRLKPIQQRHERHVERSERSRQALCWNHAGNGGHASSR